MKFSKTAIDLKILRAAKKLISQRGITFERAGNQSAAYFYPNLNRLEVDRGIKNPRSTFLHEIGHLLDKQKTRSGPFAELQAEQAANANARNFIQQHATDAAKDIAQYNKDTLKHLKNYRAAAVIESISNSTDLSLLRAGINTELYRLQNLPQLRGTDLLDSPKFILRLLKRNPKVRKVVQQFSHKNQDELK